jgi:hypothetical protein
MSYPSVCKLEVLNAFARRLARLFSSLTESYRRRTPTRTLGPIRPTDSHETGAFKCLAAGKQCYPGRRLPGILGPDAHINPIEQRAESAVWSSVVSNLQVIPQHTNIQSLDLESAVLSAGWCFLKCSSKETNPVDGPGMRGMQGLHSYYR